MKQKKIPFHSYEVKSVRLFFYRVILFQVLQSPNEFELEVAVHLALAERCLFAYTGTDQLDKACDLLDTLLRER